MKIGVYSCQCGGIVAERIDSESLGKRLGADGSIAYLKTVDLACSEEGRAWIARDISEEAPDRVVIAACSPREHEETFREVMGQGGMNPFLMQLVNIREHVAWMTPDLDAATDKAFHQIRGAVSRVARSPAFLIQPDLSQSNRENSYPAAILAIISLTDSWLKGHPHM